MAGLAIQITSGKSEIISSTYLHILSEHIVNLLKGIEREKLE